MENDTKTPIEKEEATEEKVEAIFSDYVMKMPESEKEENSEVITEPNRPAHWSQRIAAGVIDLCILFLSVWGLYSLFLMSGLGDSLRSESRAIQEVVDYYKLVPLVSGSDETYGYKIYEGETEYDETQYKDYAVYTEESTGYKYKVVDYSGVTDEVKEAYTKAVAENSKYQSAVFNYKLKDYGIIMLAGGIAEVVFLFVVPLLNKDRATIGKLAAGLKVINKKYQVEARWYQMFGRLIWSLSIESALPLLFLPTVGYFTNTIMTALVVPLALFIITLTNKDRCTLHDFVARTRVIDKRTYVPLNEQ